VPSLASAQHEGQRQAALTTSSTAGDGEGEQAIPELKDIVPAVIHLTARALPERRPRAAIEPAARWPRITSENMRLPLGGFVGARRRVQPPPPLPADGGMMRRGDRFRFRRVCWRQPSAGPGASVGAGTIAGAGIGPGASAGIGLGASAGIGWRFRRRGSVSRVGRGRLRRAWRAPVSALRVAGASAGLALRRAE
jgi:hypothetical protein